MRSKRFGNQNALESLGRRATLNKLLRVENRIMLTSVSKARGFRTSLIMVALLSSCEGPTGPAGSSGSPGLSGLQTVSTEISVESGAISSLRPECPADKRVISGGFAAIGDGSQFVTVYQSFPVSATAWGIAVRNGFGGGSIRVTAFAICASTI